MRWTVKRKLEILAALQAEITTGGKIEKQHGITAEELSIWNRNFEARGSAGLRASVVAERDQNNEKAMPPIVSPADLTDNERRVLTQLLLNTIANDPFPLSPRIRTLHAVLAKLDRPPSAREPAPRRNAKATSTARATTPSRSGRG